jgi:agmatine deiminase
MYLIPEWTKPKSLVLVWPEGLCRRSHLVPFYLDLISLVPESVPLVLLVKHKKLMSGALRAIHKINPRLQVNVHELPMVQDIWIRDWAPAVATNEQGKRVGIKAVYRPRYGQGAKASRLDDLAGTALASLLGLPLTNVPLVWDFGNLAYNGRANAIITNRLISDNETLSIDTIRSTLHKKLEFARIIFIPVEPGDETGHTDGTIRFLDENRLLIAQYPKSYALGQKFMEEQAEFLSARLGVELVRMPQPAPEDRLTEGIGSAVGCYINYLRHGNTIFMPNYGIRHDSRANRILRDAGMTVVPVRSRHSNVLARLGGVLNCISWCAY